MAAYRTSFHNLYFFFFFVVNVSRCALAKRIYYLNEVSSLLFSFSYSKHAERQLHTRYNPTPLRVLLFNTLPGVIAALTEMHFLPTLVMLIACSVGARPFNYLSSV